MNPVVALLDRAHFHLKASYLFFFQVGLLFISKVVKKRKRKKEKQGNGKIKVSF